MRFPNLANRLFQHLMRRVIARRQPDFVVGAEDPSGAYLRRWWLIPRNRWLNVYLHEFLRDDDDRALHDHPWPWLSFLLAGAYIEHTIAAGGVHHRALRAAGSLKASGPWRAHRVELTRRVAGGRMRVVPAWTVFITGPVLRTWGFHCPRVGWVPWQRFTAEGKPGEVGPGCDQ
jgi:hypothetical protein